MTIYTALITPFLDDLSLDKKGFETLLEKQAEAGIDGIVVLGTTAESPTLELEEKEWLVTKAATSSLPLMVGCGTNSTKGTLRNIEWAASLGASEALLVNPYYNLPPPAGLIAHFLALADRSPLPIILYNHPGRTGIAMPPQMVAELAMHPNIVGIKEVTTHFIDTLVTLKRLRPDFRVYTGDDQLTLTCVTNGGDGAISVASNLIPKEMKKLVSMPLPAARKLQYELWPLFQALTTTTNPIPLKAAMRLKGLPAGIPRLPLVPLDEPECHRLKELLI